jgi:hypothetical protein
MFWTLFHALCDSSSTRQAAVGKLHCRMIPSITAKCFWMYDVFDVLCRSRLEVPRPLPGEKRVVHDVADEPFSTSSLLALEYELRNQSFTQRGCLACGVYNENCLEPSISITERSLLHLYKHSGSNTTSPTIEDLSVARKTYSIMLYR